MATQQMKTWNVRVHRGGRIKELGQVHETSEELARCAALSKFGISEEEADEGSMRAGIYPSDDFDVSPA
jgi:hypothetical protein